MNMAAPRASETCLLGESFWKRDKEYGGQERGRKACVGIGCVKA